MKSPRRTPRVHRWTLLVSGVAAIAMTGCGSSSTAEQGAASVPENAATTTTQARPATHAPTSRSAERFDVGVATAALPPGWQLQSNPDAVAARRQARSHDDPLSSGFFLVRRQADSAVPMFPFIAISEGSAASPAIRGKSLAEQKTLMQGASFHTANNSAEPTLLDDTTLDSTPAFVLNIVKSETAAGSTSTTRGISRSIHAPRRGKTYILDLEVRGTTISDADLAALEALRDSWRWK